MWALYQCHGCYGIFRSYTLQMLYLFVIIYEASVYCCCSQICVTSVNYGIIENLTMAMSHLSVC